MKITIPFTKDILFKSKIAEITSISLEHELNKNDAEVTGNFIVSGEYKTHEISVNKEKFKYALPFNVEITDSIDLDSINLKITDFTYDVVGDDILRVNIESEVTADEKKVDELKEELRESIVEFEKPELEIDPTPANEILEDVEEKKEEPISEEIRIDENDKKTILDSIADKDDEYTTYNIHIVREIESLESICAKYNVSEDIVKEYNDVENINIGDKLIIPIIEDE